MVLILAEAVTEIQIGRPGSGTAFAIVVKIVQARCVPQKPGFFLSSNHQRRRWDVMCKSDEIL